MDYYENRIKQDREATFFVFLTALSKDTIDPQNLFLRGDSSIGKTWVVQNVLNLFGDKPDIWMLGGLSPTALVHQFGTFVDANGQEIDVSEKPNIKAIKEELTEGDVKPTQRAVIAEYGNRLRKWNDKIKGAHHIVDLHGKLLVFLDAPRVETFTMLRPILSHDKEEISYRFTDKDSKGALRTSHVIIKGWPATIFCTTEKEWMEDFITRSLTVTPKTTEIKLREACILVGMDAAFPFDDLREGIDAKQRLLLECLEKTLADSNFQVAVPFGKEIGETVPLNKPRVMRDLRHILAFIKINALLNHEHRPKITGRKQTVVLASYEDFRVVMEFFRFAEETTVTGLNAHVLQLFHDLMEPLDTFTYATLVDKCKEIKHPLSSSTLRKYVQELGFISYVDEQSDPEDKRRKIIRVIKKEEKALVSVVNRFGAVFKVETFKAWLKRLTEISRTTGLLLNDISQDNWSNDVEMVFSTWFTPSENEVSENLESCNIPETKGLASFSESASEVRGKAFIAESHTSFPSDMEQSNNCFICLKPIPLGELAMWGGKPAHGTCIPSFDKKKVET